MEIIPEAFLEQNLFVRGHEMRDPDGREQCKWHSQMRRVCTKEQRRKSASPTSDMSNTEG